MSQPIIKSCININRNNDESLLRILSTYFYDVSIVWTDEDFHLRIVKTGTRDFETTYFILEKYSPNYFVEYEDGSYDFVESESWYEFIPK